MHISSLSFLTLINNVDATLTMTTKTVFLLDNGNSDYSVLLDHLAQLGFRLEHTAGNDLSSSAISASPDIILIDEEIAGHCSEATLQSMRGSLNTLIIIATNNPSDLDRLIWREMGATEVICKSATPQTIAARFMALLAMDCAHPAHQLDELALGTRAQAR